MLRSVGAWILSVALALLSTSAFRQALNEFRDTEPGSLIFGALQVVIGASAAVAAVGLVKRATWAARSIGIWGIATAALIVAQPMFEPMTSEAERGLWLGAAAVGAAAIGVRWFARRLARQAVSARASVDAARDQSEAPLLLQDAQRPAEASFPPAPDEHGSLHHRSSPATAATTAPAPRAPQ